MLNLQINTLSFCMLMVISASTFAAKPMTDDEVRQLMIKSDLANFRGECPCPYHKFKRKEVDYECGDRSEYFKTGSTIKCYPEDILKYEITEYRLQNDIPTQK